MDPLHTLVQRGTFMPFTEARAGIGGMVYSIFLHPANGRFDVEKIRAWLEGQPGVLLDPLGSGIYMVCGRHGTIENARQKRIDKPSQFPYCVLVTIKPDEINIFQEYGNDDKLRSAREFVGMIVDETGCEVLDEYGKNWTDQVRLYGVGVLYPPELREEGAAPPPAAPTGWHGRRLAEELNGKSEAEFIAIMAGEVRSGLCLLKPTAILGPPPQTTTIFQFPDKTIVRYKPLGDKFHPGPFYTIEITKDESPWMFGPDAIAFKITAKGDAVPKDPLDARNPYGEGTLQGDVFQKTLMNAGRFSLTR